MKPGGDPYLAQEIERVPHSKRYWIFVIIFVAELMFSRLDGQADFLGSLGVTLAIFLIAYLGSLIVAIKNRSKALYSIAFTLYILLTIGGHKLLK